MSGRLIIFSAPSGAGKSTLVQSLIDSGIEFSFSVSATSRQPRGNERNGVEYYFLTPDEFKRKINTDEFVEYEEVYPDCFYGTLKSELQKKLDEGKTLIFKKLTNFHDYRSAQGDSLLQKTFKKTKL